MQTNLYKYWGLHLHRFPHELLLKIIQELGAKSRDLQNLRLTCRLLHDLCTTHMFAKITLPRNLDSLTRATDIICKPNIGKHIREVEINALSLVPRSCLFVNGNENPIVLQVSAAARLVELLPRWTSTFAVNLFRSFASCKGNVQKLRIIGFPKQNDIHSTHIQRLDDAFIGSLVELLATHEFKALGDMYFDIRDVGTLGTFLGRYTSGSGATLEKSISSVRKLAYDNTSHVNMNTRDRTDEFLAFVMHLDLRSLELTMGDCNASQIMLNTLSMNPALTTLKLDNVWVADNLTRVLAKMKDLREIRLDCVMLEPEQDRWEGVFQVILRNACLEYAFLNDMTYARMEGDCGCGFFSRFKADVRAYFKLIQRLETMEEAKPVGPPESSWVDICYCYDK